MRGPVDENGMDAAVLEDTIRTAVLDLVDHRDLGRDVPALQGLVSTGENLARAFFDLLGGSAPGAALARDPGGNREQPVRVWAGRRRSGCTGQGLVPGWMRLTGRVVLVSGGSRGIGRAIAGALAAEGALLANLARGRAGLEEAAEEIQTGGGHALVIAGDASQEATAAGAVAATMRAFGRLDLLVTAQGTGSFGPLEASRVADWNTMIAANLRANLPPVPGGSRTDAQVRYGDHHQRRVAGGRPRHSRLRGLLSLEGRSSRAHAVAGRGGAGARGPRRRVVPRRGRHTVLGHGSSSPGPDADAAAGGGGRRRRSCGDSAARGVRRGGRPGPHPGCPVTLISRLASETGEV